MSVIVNPVSDEARALEMLEEVRNIVESKFYLLRDEELNSDQLFNMRITLRDACDTLMIATRHIERVQRAVEDTEPEQL
jgi:hypothetical protein